MDFDVFAHAQARSKGRAVGAAAPSASLKGAQIYIFSPLNMDICTFKYGYLHFQIWIFVLSDMDNYYLLLCIEKFLKMGGGRKF